MAILQPRVMAKTDIDLIRYRHKWYILVQAWFLSRWPKNLWSAGWILTWDMWSHTRPPPNPACQQNSETPDVHNLHGCKTHPNIAGKPCHVLKKRFWQWLTVKSQPQSHNQHPSAPSQAGLDSCNGNWVAGIAFIIHWAPWCRAGRGCKLWPSQYGEDGGWFHAL